MADKKLYRLVPFHVAEGLTLGRAAEVAGKSERTHAVREPHAPAALSEHMARRPQMNIHLTHDGDDPNASVAGFGAWRQRK
jgi:hypothetical protein